MAFLKNIRQRFGCFFLNRLLKNITREKRVFNITSAKKAGIIFNLNEDPKRFKKIKEFLHYLIKNDVKVFSLAFIDAKKINEMYIATDGINIFTRKDLNFFFIPQCQFVKEFIHKDFDLLIDLTLENIFPLSYISKLSKSKFKVGAFHEKNEHLDFMINIEKNRTLEYFIEQTKHYLNIIKH